jgi:hypothetical protein
MFFTIMGALACAVFGMEEYSLAKRSSSEPEEISLRDLIKRGPEGNPNIILKDFSIFEDYVVQKKLVGGRWTKVWVPIIPSDGDEAEPEKPAAIHAFIFSQDVGSDREVRQRFDRPKLRGLINQDAPKPGIIGSVLLQKRYPGTNPRTCLIIEEGKEPAGIFKLTLFSVGFVLLIGLTGGIWYLARLLDKVESEPKPAEGENKEAEPALEVLPADGTDIIGRPPEK